MTPVMMRAALKLASPRTQAAMKTAASVKSISSSSEKSRQKQEEARRSNNNKKKRSKKSKQKSKKEKTPGKSGTKAESADSLLEAFHRGSSSFRELPVLVRTDSDDDAKKKAKNDNKDKKDKKNNDQERKKRSMKTEEESTAMFSHVMEGLQGKEQEKMPSASPFADKAAKTHAK